MSLTPEDVERKTFKEKFKGYDMDEVDTFLDRVVARLKEISAERDELRRQLREAEHSTGESEQLLQRTLITAQRTADETVAQARAEADGLVDEARAEAEWLRRQAQDEAARERERLQAEGEQLVRVISELKAFRDGYVPQLRRAIEAQVGALERVSTLPDVPNEIEELAASLAAAADAQGPVHDPVAELPSEQPVGRSALDTGADADGGGDPHAGE